MLIFGGDMRIFQDFGSDFSVSDGLFSMICHYDGWKVLDFNGYCILQVWYTDNEHIYTILHALSSL